MTLKALNWRQVAALTDNQLEEMLDTEDVYDDVTLQLAEREQENREIDFDLRASESQAAYDDFWRA